MVRTEYHSGKTSGKQSGDRLYGLGKAKLILSGGGYVSHKSEKPSGSFQFTIYPVLGNVSGQYPDRFLLCVFG